MPKIGEEILSHLCCSCHVRFYYDADSDEIVCPVCGSHYWRDDYGGFYGECGLCRHYDKLCSSTIIPARARGCIQFKELGE